MARRRTSTSPTQRTMKRIRDLGGKCGVVERYNSFIHQRFDLFGFIDVVALYQGSIVGVQCCSTGDLSTHLHKFWGDQDLMDAGWDWLQFGGTIEFWGWTYYKLTNKEDPSDRRKWRETVICITESDFYEED